MGGPIALGGHWSHLSAAEGDVSSAFSFVPEIWCVCFGMCVCVERFLRILRFVSKQRVWNCVSSDVFTCTSVAHSFTHTHTHSHTHTHCFSGVAQVCRDAAGQ